MKYRKIFLVAVSVCIALAVTSCDQLMSSLFGTNIEARILAFEKTLNTEDRSDILDHIHPDMKNRNQLKDPTVIDVSYLSYSNHPFTIGAPDVDGNIAVCSYLDGNGATGTIEFTMALDGYDYKILKLKLTLENYTDPLEFKRLLEKAAEENI